MRGFGESISEDRVFGLPSRRWVSDRDWARVRVAHGEDVVHHVHQRIVGR